MSEIALPGLWLPEPRIQIPRLGRWWRRTLPQELLDALVTIPAAPIAAAGNTVTIPAHVAGDLLICGGYDNAANTLPTIPAAGGTVPTWTAIDNPAGANLNALAVAWATAAGTTDTSGTWTNATHMVAIVLRGAKAGAAAIGAHAQGGTAAANSSVAPAITLQNLSGLSLVLAIHFHKGVTAFGAAPAGWTQQLASVTGLVAVNTLNDTTVSPGATTQTDTSVSGGYRAETIEILALGRSLVVASRASRNSLLRR